VPVVELRPNDGHTYRIVKCTKCDFVFTANPFESTHARGANTTLRERRQPAVRHYRIEGLLRALKLPGVPPRIVEVGAGHGLLADLLRHDFDYCGYEPNKERAELCQEQGLNVTNTSFDRTTAGEESVDGIVIDNVLEHVSDPERMIADSYVALKRGGVLIVIVPSIRDVRRLMPKWRRRHHFQRVHINYFSPEHLQVMLVRNGFKPCQFGFRGFDKSTARLIPYALADTFGLHPLGLYYYAIKTA
jgi:SAM-dependent methyltransferase